jgi:hypothetical protein
LEVNIELIESDINKKRRGRRTRRYPITPEFIEATACFKAILDFFKDIKVISLNQFKNFQNSTSLEGGEKPLVLKSIFEYYAESTKESLIFQDSYSDIKNQTKEDLDSVFLQLKKSMKPTLRAPPILFTSDCGLMKNMVTTNGK